MPVLPLVGSMMTVSLSMRPARSTSSIIATPMRSLTDASGLKNSHLASTTPCPGGTRRLIRTSGVPPLVSVMSLKTRPWGFRGIEGSRCSLLRRLDRQLVDEFHHCLNVASVQQHDPGSIRCGLAFDTARDRLQFRLNLVV